MCRAHWRARISVEYLAAQLKMNFSNWLGWKDVSEEVDTILIQLLARQVCSCGGRLLSLKCGVLRDRVVLSEKPSWDFLLDDQLAPYEAKDLDGATTMSAALTIAKKYGPPPPSVQPPPSTDIFDLSLASPLAERYFSSMYFYPNRGSENPLHIEDLT